MFWRLACVSPCEGNIVMRLTCSGDTASEEEAESGVAGEDMVIVGFVLLFVVLKHIAQSMSLMTVGAPPSLVTCLSLSRLLGRRDRHMARLCWT